MVNGDREVIVSELKERLEEYVHARNPHDEVMAVKEFLGTYYHNCGNRRLDRHMLAIQGQQTLLRHIYAANVKERGAEAETFRQMLDNTIAGDADAVCQTLQKYTDHMTLIVEGAVSR